MYKVAFLDRDGTINKDYPDSMWSNIKEPELLPNTIQGLRILQDLGYKLIIITNQYIIADGIITLEDYHKFNDKLLDILNNNGINISRVYYCPHNDNDNCICKKPKTGMVDNALKDFDIDLEKSIYIGDSVGDKKLAHAFNLKFYGVKGINNNDVFKYESIYDVAKLLNS